MSFILKINNKYKVESGTSTPWGASQDAKKIMPGLIWYDTAGHGGLYVSQGLAEKKLSPQARAEGIRYAGAYWYEEDAQWSIPMYENPEWIDLCMEKKVFSSKPTKEELKKRIEESMPEYFKEAKHEIINFKDIAVGDMLYLDRENTKPFSVVEHKGDNLTINRESNRYKLSKKSYFNRVIKVERDGNLMKK